MYQTNFINNCLLLFADDTVLQPQVLNHIVDSIEHDPAFDAFFSSFTMGIIITILQ